MAEEFFKILIATDIHLGYDEKDPLRSRDSINTFEEILQISQEHDVDFILLGGDLFHENKPSRFIEYECIRLIRRYCMSNRPVKFEFVSDATINFSHSMFPHVNYEDENLNVGMPIFTINGNHDDVTGQNLCALDVLHEAGLLNYFGKYTNVEKIDVSPILLRKNGIQLAMYGLGAVRDERLHRMFLSNQVKFLTFPGETQQDNWFNLFVLHQNRVKHGLTNYIPDKMLPDFFDLVVWGHEHPCGGAAEDAGNFHILQPGSSVATSLCQGESGEKNVFLLKIKNSKDFKLEKIKLRTVRQFYFEEIILSELGIRPNKMDTTAKVMEYCDQKIFELVSRAENERSGHDKQPKEPLIRLSIDYSGNFEAFNSVRFGQKFVKMVGNPKDLLIFHKRRQENKEKIKLDHNLMDRLAKENPEDLLARVEDMVKLYFADVERTKQMLIITERGMGDAMKDFVDKDEKDSLQEVFMHQLDRCKTRLKQKNLSNEEEIKLVLEEIHKLRLAKENKAMEDEDRKDVEKALERSRKRKLEEYAANGNGHGDDDDGVEMIDDDDENGHNDSSTAPKPSTNRRGKSTTPKGRGTPAPRGRGSRGKRGQKL